ncbi:SEL1-like repeat protein [Noviherbaspirillum soli]|uniref:SEL1-like repeat protein n=1 Tax=Noviherbaspirillum soli TaxID=1064518 RepID=UPI00188A51B7|nr:SEL1-like repeat protein [Noviherbaspirillum soli]
MQSNNPANGASGSGHSFSLFASDGISVGVDSGNGQAATGQGGATRQPRLHAGGRSGTPLISDDDRLPDDDALAIDALNDQLRSLRATNPLDLGQTLQFFDAVKASEQTLKAFLRDDPHNAALRRLADGLYVILPRLRVLLCGDGNASLGIDAIHTLCMGLSTCVAPALGAMFDKKRQQELKPDLQAITDTLMERACKAGMPASIASIGIVLGILNWASRALKADCIAVSQPVKTVFDHALTVLGQSLAGKLSTCELTTHQLGKCAVQINAIFKFNLIRLDDSEEGLAGRRRLATCGEWLCSTDMAARLGDGRIDAVACTNVCNLVKDMMDHGLLPAATNGQLSQGLTGLVELILRIPANQMLADDCRTLSNCANFLRVLGSHGAGVPEQALVPNWGAASHALLGMMDEDTFMACLPSSQAVANLISFVKRCDRHLQQRPSAGRNTTATTPAGPITTTMSPLTKTAWPAAAATVPTTAGTGPEFTQYLLRRAANHLIQHALLCGPDAFTAPETLSGLLSGLDYIVRRNLVPATPELEIFTAILMDNMAWCSSTWKEKSRMVALPALLGLLTAKLVTLAQAQPGLAALLGPCNNASAYSMAGLAAAIRDKGVIEDEVPALPPAEVVPLVLKSPSRNTLRPPLPPGYTRVIPQSTASSGHGARGKKAASSSQAATSARTTTQGAKDEPESQPWHIPRKVGRAHPEADVPSAMAALLPRTQQPAPPAAAMPPEQKAKPKPKQATQQKRTQKQNQQTGRAANASAKPEDEWFALLGSRDPNALKRLRELASQPGLLNRKKGKGQESQSALACALASGHLAAVKWLLAAETGYRFDEPVGAFLSAVEQCIALLDNEVIASLDYFLAMQDDTARTALQRHFAAHQPASVGMQNLLKRHGLAGAGVAATIPTFRTPTTGISTTTTTTVSNRKTYDQEDARTQFTLGDCYWNGTGVKQDKAQAFAWYNAAANQGLAEAQLKLGNCYWSGIGVSVDKARAFAWYSAAAHQGLAEAQSSVGYCYQKGIGVKEHKAQAAGWYRTAARNGDATAQYSLGMCHEFGIGVNVDMAMAFEWYRKAAHQGLAQAEFALGNCYENGAGVKKDKAQAVEWYEKAANQGLAGAQFNLGICYGHGTGIAQDYAKAANWYEKAAHQGLAGAQFNLSNCYGHGIGVIRNYARAFAWCEKAAIQGLAEAQLNLGKCYGDGTGVTQNYARAFEWYQKAAIQGLAGAQLNLGTCYGHGIGVSNDYAKAVEWYEKAANKGLPEAQFSLGSFYWNGLGVKEDKTQGFTWYRKAADQGYAKAQLNLGKFLLEGISVKMDQKQALEWYRKAANQGLPEAQFSLGHCYWYGMGVDKDLNQATHWFRKAADQGYTQANKFLN